LFVLEFYVGKVRAHAKVVGAFEDVGGLKAGQ
jgi:hypothetical protein